MTFDYPIEFTVDSDGSILVTFPDFPEAITFGEDEDEARLRAVDAIETAIIGRMSDREDIPAPSRLRKGQALVTLPTLAGAKVALYEEMRAQGVTKAALARRLHCDFSEVARLLDLRHASRLDRLDAALASLDKRLDVRIVAMGKVIHTGNPGVIVGAASAPATATHSGRGGGGTSKQSETLGGRGVEKTTTTTRQRPGRTRA